ncbi:MAG: hypothetical protein CR982_09640 [Candidatus Cloacimonadota bacterium]|nr:MAG: hypothetical protein CR982_09640 [Candidatus Cloacimonadota bacterium]PIE79300.1 MAG: hypothetical protein CSA15_03815 [Candidatus Delongbacteria bacterium]
MRNKTILAIFVIIVANLKSEIIKENILLEYPFNFTTKNNQYLFKSDDFYLDLFRSNFSKENFKRKDNFPKINDLTKREKENTLYSIELSASVTDSIRYDKDDDENLNSLSLKNNTLINIGKNLTLYNQMLLDQALYDNPNYSGKKWNGLAGYTRVAFCEYRYNFLTARFGKYPVDQGVSNFDNLLFSETHEGFTKLHLIANFDHFSFETFSGKLNSIDRNISMHRVKFDINRYIKFNITEVAVYTGETNIEYVNPFTFYHGVQLNGGGESNTIGYFEFETYPTDYLRIYSGLLIDDIQVEEKSVGDLEPNELGWIIGFSFKDIISKDDLFEYEYSGITNRTFNTTHKGQKFMLGEADSETELLGNKLGNDFDIHRARYINKVNNSIKWNISLSYLRKGEGSVQGDFDEPWEEFTLEEGYSEKFPYGDIKYTFESEIGVNYNYKNLINFDLHTLYSKTMNEDYNIKVGLSISTTIEYFKMGSI